MKDILNVQHLIGAVVYSGLGMIAFAASFILFDKLTPYDLWQEIVVKQNRALATIIAGVSIAIGIIIAASMIG